MSSVPFLLGEKKRKLYINISFYIPGGRTGGESFLSAFGLIRSKLFIIKTKTPNNFHLSQLRWTQHLNVRTWRVPQGRDWPTQGSLEDPGHSSLLTRLPSPSSPPPLLPPHPNLFSNSVSVKALLPTFTSISTFK